MRAPRPEQRIAAAFSLAALAALGFAALTAFGGQTQLEGLLLATACAGLAYGFASWAANLLEPETVVEERHAMEPSQDDREAWSRDLDESGGRIPPLLRRTLLAAFGGLGLAALFPLRSLFASEQRPDRALARTAWRPGTRLVTADGDPVRPDDLEVGTMVTVFPETTDPAVGTDPAAADSVTVLLRLLPDEMELPEGREDWAVGGIVAFSKLCTHVGCPVGLFETTTRHLLCPCHQSAFDVPRGAVPVMGPAARPLPQLPLAVGDDGFLQARGDFPAPVGPSHWQRR